MSANSKWIRRSAAAVVSLAAVGVLSACSTGQSGSAAPAGGASGATTTSSAANVPKQTSALINNGVAPTSGEALCADVEVTFGEETPSPGGTDQVVVALTMTNAGDETCVLQGFPGVQLQGADGSTWDLVRSDDQIVPVSLAPGDWSSAPLTLAPAADGNGYRVESVLITPPNTEDTQLLTWGFGPLTRQDGATRPATYVGAVTV
jgi:hypothetical protein